MTEIIQDQEPREEVKLPFNNLYLVSGRVSGLNQAWMYAFTFLLAAMGYIGIQLLCAAPLIKQLEKNGYSISDVKANEKLLFDHNALGIDRNIVLLLELLMFVFALVGLYTGIRYVHRKKFISVITGYDRFRFGRLFFAFSVWALLILIVTFLAIWLNPAEYTFSFQPLGFLVSLLLALTLIPLQSFTEELMFRGYFIQGLSLLFKNGIIPLLLTSALFGCAHLGNPEVEQYGWPIMLSYYTSFGFFMGFITLLDEGLELAIGLHVANNAISSILISDKNSVIKSYALFDTATTSADAEFLVWAVMAAVTFSIFWFKYRWKNFKLVIK